MREKRDLEQELSHQQQIQQQEEARKNGLAASRSGVNGTRTRSSLENIGSASGLSDLRSEEENAKEEQHDVLAFVQVCELAPEGDYVPVQVLSNTVMDSGAFQLRQGLQRRIILSLSHTSGRQFQWNKVSGIQVGNVRLVDNKGRTTDSPARDADFLSTLCLVKRWNIQLTAQVISLCKLHGIAHSTTLCS